MVGRLLHGYIGVSDGQVVLFSDSMNGLVDY